MNAAEDSAHATVVIPAFNRQRTIARAVHSVLKQDFEDVEVIVVDDGSSDNTAEVVEELQDSRVRLVRQDNRGVSSARNTGAKLARTQILLFLDSDDEALPGWLSSMCAPLNDPRCGVACCGFIHPTKGPRPPRRHGPLFQGFTAAFETGTYAIRRELFLAIGGFAEGLAKGEITEMAYRLTRELKQRNLQIASISRALVRKHSSDEPRQRMRTYHQKRYDGVRYILDQHEDFLRKDPGALANYYANLGVSAVSLGRKREGRQSLVRAIRVHPYDARNYARLLITYFPIFARRRW